MSALDLCAKLTLMSYQSLFRAKSQERERAPVLAHHIASVVYLGVDGPYRLPDPPGNRRINLGKHCFAVGRAAEHQRDRRLVRCGIDEILKPLPIGI